MQSKDINTKLIIYTIIFIYAMKDSCEKFIGIGLYIYISKYVPTILAIRCWDICPLLCSRMHDFNYALDVLEKDE